LKFLGKILSAPLLVAAIFSAAVWSNSGRDALLNFAATFLKTKNITLVVEGTDKKITKIQKIFVRVPDGSELTFSNVTLDRESFFSKSSVNVGTFVFTKAKTKQKKTDLNVKEFASFAQTLKFFIKTLSIENGILHIDDKVYALKDFIYKSGEDEDVLVVKTDKNQSINAVFRRSAEGRLEGELSFENIFNSSGRALIFAGETTKYELFVENDKFKIISNGEFENFMSDIKINKAFVEYKNVVYDFSGNLYLTKQTAALKTRIDLEPLANSMSPEISYNFKDVFGELDVDCDFSKNLTCRARAVFKKSEAVVGNADCVYENDKIKIAGDIGWINVRGFEFSKFICEINNQKQASVNLFGKDFEIISELKFDDRILIEKFELKSPKGFIKASKPFFIAEDCAFDFNFSRLDFFDKIAPISGVGSGSFAYKNKTISGQADFPELSIKDNAFHSLSFSSDGKTIKATTKDAQIFGVRLKNLKLETSDERFNLSGKANEDGVLKASGEIAKSFKKISLKEATIKFPNNEIKFESCAWDAASNDCKIRCVLTDNKKSGEAEINFGDREAVCLFKTFPIDKFMKLFDRRFPSCRLDGNLKLKAVNGNFVGDGRLIASNLIAHKRDLEIFLKISADGTKINANLKNRKDFLEASAFLPINFKSDGSIPRNLRSGLLDYRLKANVRLENLLELSDYFDLRGDLDCDFCLSGSFANPTISGRAQLNKAHIEIGSILLKNGSISLIGNGRTISVLQAEFVDYKNRKANVSGSAKLFFDGILPNIDADLKLAFNNFALFDSDDLRIDVKGEGSMSGPLKDMIIRGNIVVPKCEIQDFASEETESDIQIENDPYSNESKDEQKRKDFFKYDVSMRCEDIKFTGNIFEMRLKGDLQLSTYEERGTLIGELKLFDGKLDLFGKRMKFTDGNVKFLREFPFNPKALFKCRRNFGDISVGLDIKNSPTKGASFELYSTPSYTRDVILSKMLFGKESKYLTVSEAAQLAHAVASFNRRGYVFSVLNTFQNIGIIDNISFATANDRSSSLYTDSQSGSQNDINMSAGKYIHDNVYISVNKKEEDGACFDIDFSVTPKISIKANTNGEAGVSWKYRY
jgi:hypothetical protein